MKHPMTPRTVFMNCYEYDRVRKVIIARCKICNIQISRNVKDEKELFFRCTGTACNCGQMVTHPVCSLCYDMYHALYLNFSTGYNPGLKDRDYFKKIDDKQRQDWENYKRRENGTT
jgi:hypothetical protein